MPRHVGEVTGRGGKPADLLQAVFFLKTQSIARLDVVNYITHGISKVSNNDEESPE